MAEHPASIVEARAALGTRLARLRSAGGYTQETFATLTFYGRSSIANIETGRQAAPRDFWVACDKILQTGGLLATEHDRLASMRRDHQLSLLQSAHLDQPATPTTRSPLRPALRGDAHRFLKTHSAITGEVVDAKRDVSSLHTGLPNGQDLSDPDYISHWNRMLSVLAAAGNAIGGNGLIDVISTEVNVIARHAALATGPAADDYLLTQARWLEFGSWIADNQGDRACATAWLRRASELAARAGHSVLEAYLLMRRAQRAHEDGHSRASLDILGQVSPAPLPARIAALLATRAAQAHSALLDGKAARACMKQAIHLVDRERSADPLEIALASHGTASYVMAHEGICLLSLGEPNGAASILEGVLADWPPSHKLDEGLFRANYALAHAMAGSRDEAVSETTRALRLGVETGSRRTLRVIHQILRHDLAGAVGYPDLTTQWASITGQEGS